MPDLTSDDVGPALREIADLLRQRVEQNAEMAKRSEERLVGFRARRDSIPDFAAIEAKHDAMATAHREDAARVRAEDIAFRERLLKAIEDQNALLRGLLERVAPSTESRR